jgi:hypothetical protein
MRKIFFSIFLLFIGYTSKCQPWLYVTSDADGKKTFIQSVYITKENRVVKCLRKSYCKTATYFKNGKKLVATNVSVIMLCAYDCNERAITNLSEKIYNFKGDLIYSNDNPVNKQACLVVNPGSIEAAVLERVCLLHN